MSGFIELHDGDGDAFVLRVESVERVDTMLSTQSGRRTLIRTISGDYLYPSESYSEVVAMLAPPGYVPLPGDPEVLSIPSTWKPTLPKLAPERPQDG